MDEVINVFLPMRAGSQRVLKKNTRPFANISGGLCKIKVCQLLNCKKVNDIYVSTDDPTVIQVCNELGSNRIKTILRSSHLASSSTSTDELIKYVPEILPKGHILWTHVTSPFIDSHVYDRIIQTYFENISDFDSLMTVTKVQKFFWKGSNPINYDRDLEKWPRTQTLEPVWEVNSGAFLASRDFYLNRSDRIGEKPYLYELSQEIAFDIDWPIDFKLAELLYKMNLNEVDMKSEPVSIGKGLSKSVKMSK